MELVPLDDAGKVGKQDGNGLSLPLQMEHF